MAGVHPSKTLGGSNAPSVSLLQLEEHFRQPQHALSPPVAINKHKTGLTFKNAIDVFSVEQDIWRQPEDNKEQWAYAYGYV